MSMSGFLYLFGVSKFISAERERNAVMVVFITALVALAVCVGGATNDLQGANADCSAARNIRRLSVEERSKYSPLVLRTLAVYTNPSNVTTELGQRAFIAYSAHFWLINVYKGVEAMAKHLKIPTYDDVAVYNIHDRKLNVSEFYIPVGSSERLCWKPITSQKYYIVFAALRDGIITAFNDDTTGAYEEWSDEQEAKIWRGLGWQKWSDWFACTVTCGGGIQERHRACMEASCVGYNKERRSCNMFPCKGTIEPLVKGKRKYFHPSRWLWEKVPDRKSAWRIKPSYYLRLPAKQVAFPVADFRKHFALIVSVRVDPKIRAQGTIFSLRSRSQPDTFLSLNLDGPNVLRIVQSFPNKTQSVAIPAAVADGHWHQLALGIQDNASVRSYLDCRWVSTDILRNNSLADTEDADLVIGYLFSGDLEHLILVPDSGAVVQQCSTNVISILDPDLSDKPSSHTTLSSIKFHRHPHSSILKNKKSSLSENTISSENEFVTLSDDEDAYLKDDGSGSRPIFKIEWSSWSECSVTCGIGIQKRQLLQCTQFSENDEPCPLPRIERVETRTCNVRLCTTYETNNKRSTKRKYPTSKYVADDILDNGINLTRSKYEVLKSHRMHEEDLVDVKKCKCLNGGICDDNFQCQCTKPFGGTLCEIINLEPPCNIECKNGGTCLNAGCICPKGFTGHDCGSQICTLNCETGEICPPVTTCDCVDIKYECDHNTLCRPCLNGGECSRNTCKCLPGWRGVDCSIAICEPSCRNGGYCIKPNECLCPPGTVGHYCEEYTCGSGCLNDGVCVGYDICKCPQKVTGSMCNSVLCDPPCENGATCTTNNECLCTPSTESARCAKKKCHYKAVRKPFVVGFRRLARKQYSSHCKQNTVSCASRLVPKFQTTYKTVYRTVYECTSNETTHVHS